VKLYAAAVSSSAPGRNRDRVWTVPDGEPEELVAERAAPLFAVWRPRRYSPRSGRRRWYGFVPCGGTKVDHLGRDRSGRPRWCGFVPRGGTNVDHPGRDRSGPRRWYGFVPRGGTKLDHHAVRALRRLSATTSTPRRSRPYDAGPLRDESPPEPHQPRALAPACRGRPSPGPGRAHRRRPRAPRREGALAAEHACSVDYLASPPLGLQEILYEVAKSGVATITLDDAETRNALGDRMLDELIGVLEAARDDERCPGGLRCARSACPCRALHRSTSSRDRPACPSARARAAGW